MKVLFEVLREGVGDRTILPRFFRCGFEKYVLSKLCFRMVCVEGDILDFGD